MIALGLITGIAFLGWGAAMFLGGVLTGERRARDRFDESMMAHFGEDEPETQEQEKADDDETVDLSALDTETLPTSTTKGGQVRLAVIVVGPQGEDS